MKALENLTASELQSAWWLWGYVTNFAADRYSGAKPSDLTPQQYASVLRDALAEVGEDGDAE